MVRPRFKSTNIFIQDYRKLASDTYGHSWNNRYLALTYQFRVSVRRIGMPNSEGIRCADKLSWLDCMTAECRSSVFQEWLHAQMA